MEGELGDGIVKWLVSAHAESCLARGSFSPGILPTLKASALNPPRFGEMITDLMGASQDADPKQTPNSRFVIVPDLNDFG